MKVKKMAVEFLKELFNRKVEFNNQKVNRIRQVIKKEISVEQQQDLQPAATEQEIKKTIFKIKNGKAPSPDDFIS